MKNLVWLALILAVFWIINSGHFDLLLLSLGVASVAIVIIVNQLMTRAGDEHLPTIISSPRLPLYIAWLLKEIVKSNIVIRCIWQSKPDIQPQIIKIKVSQQSDLFKVLYANSITLTPGTVTIEIEDDEFTVHALTRSSREGLESGEMNDRVRSLET